MILDLYNLITLVEVHGEFKIETVDGECTIDFSACSRSRWKKSPGRAATHPAPGSTGAVPLSWLAGLCSSLRCYPAAA